MNYAETILDTIGNTPLVKLGAMAQDLKPTILTKLEYLNPGGSMKDRIALEIIEDAEQKGLLKPGGLIVEPTSGNTGVGLAMAAALKDYKVLFTMSEKMSLEKELVLRAYGAEVVRAPAEAAPDDPRHYINLAKQLAKQRGGYLPNQYFNRANTRAHYKTTGAEIWNDTDGTITHFVAPVGTGGTISGAAKYLKEQNPDIQVIGVDTEGSMLHHYFDRTEGTPHKYEVEGPGEDFMPGALDLEVIDKMMVVSDKDALLTGRQLVTQEGIFAGGSSGLAVFATLQLAKGLPDSAVVVTILPDSGRNYVSKMYNDDWMKQKKFL